jgi:phage gpG-like protein
MATRVGKYKVSKKESALSIVDGGTVTGDVTFDSNSTTTLAGTTTLSNATVKFTGLATNAVSTSLAANQLFRTQSEFLTASNAGAAANSVGKNFDVLCVTR